MHRRKHSKALVASALARTALSAAHARPQMGYEPRQHVSFSDAIADDQPGFSHSTVDGGKTVFGELPPATFGGDELDSKVKLNHGHKLDGTFDVPKFKHGHGVAPVAAIPEPSTYVLLGAGLAGVALIGRRRRRR